METKHLVPIGVSALVVVIGLFVGHELGPFYGTYRFDPNYAYLFNGLGLLHGVTPGHIDHPGTTVQELAAITILLKWSIVTLGGIKQSITDSVLSSPEQYLSAINFVLLILDAAAVGLAVWVFIKRTGRVWLSLLTPALMMCSPSVLESLAAVKPEPLMIALAIPVVLLALPIIQLDRRAQFGRAALLGVVLGAGIVTKITFAPLALFALALPEIMFVAVAGLFTVVAWGILVMPIWPVLTVMLNWQQGLATHQGAYGEGAPGLPPMASLADAAWLLLYSEPVFALGCMLLVVAVLSGWKTQDPERPSWRRFFLIGLSVVVCQLAITTPRPSARYLLPSLVVIAVLTPWAMHFGIKDLARLRVARAVAVVVLCLVAWSGIDAFAGQVDTARQNVIELQRVADTLKRTNCRLLPYFAFGSHEYAMLFGNFYIRQAYADELMKLYPGYFAFNIWAERIEDFSGFQSADVTKDVLSSGRPFCLVGSTELTTLRHMETTLVAKEGGMFYYAIRGFH